MTDSKEMQLIRQELKILDAKIEELEAGVLKIWAMHREGESRLNSLKKMRELLLKRLVENEVDNGRGV